MKEPGIEIIKLTNLLLNIENPRFEMVGNQRDAIQKMIEDQGDKLYQLAQHITENGLDPSTHIIVTPSDKEKGRFEVLEGNRRVTALKILTNPSIIDAQNKSLINRVKKLNEQFKKKNIKDVSCIVFDDPNDAYKWIDIKHTGQNNGIGTVEWDTQQQARFDAKVNGKAPAIAIQAIDFLNKSPLFDKNLKSKLKDIKATNLGRLIGDPEFRDFIGLSQNDGMLQSNFNQSEVVKGLTKVVNDLLNPKFTVNDIYYKEDRKKYIESFKKTEIPDKGKSIAPWGLVSSIPHTNFSSNSKLKKRATPISTDRKNLIPRDFIVKIKDKRVNKIYFELKNLEIKEFENASAVLFRVFLELSMDAFIDKEKLTKVNINSELFKKVNESATYLETKNILTKQQLKPIRTASSNPNSILSVNTFNAYIHNRHFHPTEKDLKTAWDNMQLFLEKILELI